MIAVSGAAVCEACIARVRAQTDVLCTRCGDALGMESARFAAGLGMTECTMCRLAPPEFARAVAFAVYDDEVREMLNLLKFNGMRRIADRVLGDGMAQAIFMLQEQAARELVVVPVPLFAARQRSRGFNQAQVLAEAGIAKLKKLRPEWKLALRKDVLLRVKDTRSLFALMPQQRRASLRGAFRVVDAETIRGREVLVVDDIMTTGATARECAKVLLRAGAAKVWVATLARAQAESVSAVSRASDVAAWDASPNMLEPQAGQRQRFVQ
jgi:ComF family protein